MPRSKGGGDEDAWRCGWLGCTSPGRPPRPACRDASIPVTRGRSWAVTNSNGRLPPLSGDRDRRTARGARRDCGVVVGLIARAAVDVSEERYDGLVGGDARLGLLLRAVPVEGGVASGEGRRWVSSPRRRCLSAARASACLCHSTAHICFNARETRSLTCQTRAQAYTCWGARARGVRTVFEVVSRLAEEDGGKFDPTAEIECEVQGGGVGLLDNFL